MKKMIIMSLGAGILFFSSCDRNQTKSTETSTINESATTASGGMSEAERDASEQDAIFRDRANTTSTQLGNDLKLDENSRNRANEVYYNRAQQRAQLQKKYASDTTGMAQEARTMDEDTDRQLRDILTSDQYKSYEQNRDTYADRENIEMNRAGTERNGGMGTNNNINPGTVNTGTGNQQMNQGVGAGTHSNPNMDAGTHTGAHQSTGTNR